MKIRSSQAVCSFRRILVSKGTPLRCEQPGWSVLIHLKSTRVDNKPVHKLHCVIGVDIGSNFSVLTETSTFFFTNVMFDGMMVAMVTVTLIVIGSLIKPPRTCYNNQILLVRPCTNAVINITPSQNPEVESAGRRI